MADVLDKLSQIENQIVSQGGEEELNRLKKLSIEGIGGALLGLSGAEEGDFEATVTTLEDSADKYAPDLPDNISINQDINYMNPMESTMSPEIAVPLSDNFNFTGGATVGLGGINDPYGNLNYSNNGFNAGLLTNLDKIKMDAGYETGLLGGQLRIGASTDATQGVKDMLDNTVASFSWKRSF